MLQQSEISKRFRHNIPAPAKPLPGHAESYNPPPEYLFTEEEVIIQLFIDKATVNFCQLETSLIFIVVSRQFE